MNGNKTIYTAVRKDTSNDSLKHWKYLKKEKKNGKWVYYYDTDQLKNDVKDKLGYDERERMNAAHDKYIVKNREANLANESANNYAQKLGDKYYRSEFVDPNTGALKKDAQEAYDRESKKLSAKYADYKLKYEIAADAGRAYTEARAEYMKTPIGRIENLKDKVEAGKKAVSNWINKLTKKFK